jgi:hypothetical protein
MYVPVVVLNAPWNGKAEFTKSFYIQWEFGSIVTSYTQFSWSETARVYNGVNAIEYVFAKVRVCRSYAQVLQWFDYRFATYVVDPPQQAIDSSRRADKCVMRLELEEVVLRATNSSGVINAEVVSGAGKPFKKVVIACPRRYIEVSFVNDKAVVSVSNEIRDAVKDVVWKIQYKAGYRWHAVPGNEAATNLTMRGVHGIVLRKADGYSTTVVVEVVLKDGSRIVEEIGIGGYIPDTHLS